MATRAKTGSRKPTPPATPDYVVFGLVENGKAKGGRFTGREFEAASQAAASMNLRICEVASDDLKELAKKLPSGRIFARGRAFLPFIRRDLYEKLIDIVGVPGKGDAPPNVDQAIAPAAAMPVVPPLTSGLPRSWDAVAVGDLALATEGPREGWWEVVVLERTDEMVTIKFRDYPKLPPVSQHVSTLALMHPGIE